MKYFTIKKSILACLVLGTYLAHAQEVKPISKKDFFEKLQKSNLQGKIADRNYESAKADVNQASSLFLPNVSASFTGIKTNSPLMAFGTKLNQKSVTMQDFDPTLLNDPEAIGNFNTKLEVMQPLINLDGFYGRKAAIAKSDAYKYQAERTKEYLALEGYKAYLQLQLTYKATEVLERASKTSDENLKLVENYFKQGMVQKSDLLNVMVRVNEVKNQHQMMLSNVKNASNYLSFLLNENPDYIYKPIEDIDTQIQINQYPMMLNPERKDVQAIEKSTLAYQNMSKMNTLSLVPRINAFGSYELNDRKLLGFGASNYLVGVQMSWSIFDGNKTLSKVQKSKIDFLKAKEEGEMYRAQNQLELNKTIRQLSDAERKAKTSELAFEQSAEVFKIRKNRFQQGLEKTSDILMAETQMYQKELEYLQSVFEFNFTKKYLDFLTK
jgi:outer membrane protein TolC